MLLQLGKIPDKRLAIKLGISQITIFNKRKELDIPAHGKLCENVSIK
jgi:hypothetical protein